ncbi:hypothetical protein B0H19DRAFT_954177 [Mycena capillaripes]|nr:hypothetical protein B0H19DRAFT_954177 [Mycena capillaripes]
MGWGPDPNDIIHCLLEHGVEFRICLKAGVYPVPPPPPRARYTGLGYRRTKYKPTPVDHGVYVKLRNSFLASPRGRAALFAGGIVARLARLVVDQELACFGPTSEVFMTGTRLWDGQSSAAYWDDALTDEEVDLICGVYEIATGRVNKLTEERQTSHISWWPTPHAFAQSGLSIGWWSPDCERWLQEHLRNIQGSNATLHNQSEWKKSLRFYKKSRDVAQANERIAASFLDARQLH